MVNAWKQNHDQNEMFPQHISMKKHTDKQSQENTRLNAHDLYDMNFLFMLLM